MNLKTIKSAYFIGIKGVGMTSLALCFQDMGIKISGSDIAEEFVTDEILKKRGIEWNKFKNKKSKIPACDGAGKMTNQNLKRLKILRKIDLAVITGAHGGFNNPQAIAAKKMGIPVITHAQALGMAMKNKIGISVCGVGGKTTTSAMIAHILDRAGTYPSFAVGAGNIPSLNAPGRFDKKGKFFVAEADEYLTCPEIDNTPRFMWQDPKVIVLTNLAYDHPDAFKNFQETKKAFKKFIAKLPGNGFVLGDLENLGDLGKIKRTVVNKNLAKEITLGLKLKIPGFHNLYNACCAILTAQWCGIPKEKAKIYLEDFWGTKRRFEFVEETKGIKFYDDYAHHPLQIKATLNAARENFPHSRLWVIFQPHTYTRTKALLTEFAQSFSKADMIIFADIFPSAREKPMKDMSSKILTEKTRKYHQNALYLGDNNAISAYLKNNLKSGDVVFTMGAGDIYKLKIPAKSFAFRRGRQK